MTPERIAFFLPSLSGGGVERGLARVATGIVRTGAPVDVVVCEAGGPFQSELDSRIRSVDLEVKRVRKALLPLARYLTRERPLALISGLDHANVLAVASRALSRAPVRLLVTEQGNLTAAAREDRGLKLRVLMRMVRLAYPRADAVVASSQGVGDDLVQVQGIPPPLIHVLPNPVDPFKGTEPPEDIPWFREHIPVVIGAGRLVPQKSFRTLLEAFALVRRAREARLVLFGDGPERPALEARARDLGITGDVALPGFRIDLQRYMEHAAVFVLSSAWEGYSNVLVEALASGCPVVSTDCPSGPAETLSGGRHGALVPVGDASRMSVAILAMLAARPSPDVLRSSVENRTVDRVAARWLSLIRSL